MTKIASTAAIVLTVALVSGFVRSAADTQAPAQAAVTDVSHAAPMSASQKMRCAMPAAQWKGCGA
jgi:hypothetical protein